MFQKMFLSAVLLSSVFAHAKTVRSLDQVSGEIHSNEIAAEYDYQMSGTAKPDGFGSVARSDGATANALVKLLAPQTKTANIGLIGLRKWQGNQYIASFCAYHEPMKWEYATEKSRYVHCSNNTQTYRQITFAVVEQKNGVWQLAAEPYTEMFKPQNRQTERNVRRSAFSLENRDGDTVIGKMDRLDLAPYQLNENTRAFGVRYTAHVGYAGGGAMNQAMTLFAVLDGKLKPVLTVETYQFENLAGDWNPDGTRQHDIESTEYILKMSPKQTHGFYDIVWRETRSRRPQQKTFTWQPAQQRYVELKSR